MKSTWSQDGEATSRSLISRMLEPYHQDQRRGAARWRKDEAQVLNTSAGVEAVHWKNSLSITSSVMLGTFSSHIGSRAPNLKVWGNPELYSQNPGKEIPWVCNHKISFNIIWSHFGINVEEGHKMTTSLKWRCCIQRWSSSIAEWRCWISGPDQLNNWQFFFWMTRLFRQGIRKWKNQKTTIKVATGNLTKGPYG